MPKRIQDEPLKKAKAIELRSQGYSYRQISAQLGVSLFKLHQWFSQAESSRLAKLREQLQLSSNLESNLSQLEQKIAGIKYHADALENRYSVLVSTISPAQISELRHAVSELQSKLTQLESQLINQQQLVTWLNLVVHGMIFKLGSSPEKLIQEVAKQLQQKAEQPRGFKISEHY